MSTEIMCKKLRGWVINHLNNTKEDTMGNTQDVSWAYRCGEHELTYEQLVALARARIAHEDDT